MLCFFFTQYGRFYGLFGVLFPNDSCVAGLKRQPERGGILPPLFWLVRGSRKDRANGDLPLIGKYVCLNFTCCQTERVLPTCTITKPERRMFITVIADKCVGSLEIFYSTREVH